MRVKNFIKLLIALIRNEIGAIGVTLNESSLALKVETVENTAEPITSGTDYVEVLAGELEITKTSEELARDVLSGTTESEQSRRGIPEISGSIGLEFRSSKTEGAEPQSLNAPLMSLLGGKKSESSATTTTGNTATVLNFTSHSFTVGSIVTIKQANNYECRPISEITSTTITFPIALSNGAPSDGVEVSATTTYYHDTTNAKSLTAEYNIGNEIQDIVTGIKINSGTVENWTVGTIPTFKFALAGLTSTRADASQSFDPDFDADALPPVTLESCLWIGGTMVSYSELGLSIENEVSKLTDACSASGFRSQRIISQMVKFTANPYMDDSDLTSYDAWENNDDTSVFFYAFNPTTTDGEFSEAIACWIPQGKYIAHPTTDVNGIAANGIEIKSHRAGSGKNTIYISFM